MLKLLTTITGIVMSFGYYPQAWKIYKSKSSQNISLATFLVIGIGNIIWVAYGISTRDPVIILGFIAGAIGAWLVIVLCMIYRNQ